jgi:hypothetical protein
MVAPTFKPDDIELVPDAWNRFERAVDTVSKSGPLHRTRGAGRGYDPRRLSALCEAMWVLGAKRDGLSERYRQKLRELSVSPDRWAPGILQDL